ncbi:MAG: hypothetical protein WC145_03310 [Aliarcobacter sp.]|nr:hypothetical protein [Candidatus Methanomethylophilaceae archaeon]
MGKLRNMILGEKMPDKDNPKYREKYEKDVEAGRRFARATRIDRLAGHVQRFAEKHRGLFLGIVMAIVLGCLALNVRNFSRAYRLRMQQKEAVQSGPDMVLKGIRNSHTMIPIQDKEDGKAQQD